MLSLVHLIYMAGDKSMRQNACLNNFYPTALKGCQGIVLPMVSGWAGGLYLRCATSWSDLDLTFDLAVVTLTFKILSGLYLGNRKV